MRIYDTEEEQVEALKSWWQENGRSTIVGAVLGVIVIVGWNFWNDHRQEQAEQASTLYGQLLISSQEDKQKEASATAEKLIQEFPSSTYARYASLIHASLKVKAGNVAGAKTILEQQLKQSDVELKNVARIRLVRLMLATKEYEKGLQLISEVDASKSDGFSPSYDELTGDLYVALNRLGEARTAYQNALKAGQNSPLLQFKIDDITAAEIVIEPSAEVIKVNPETEKNKATVVPETTSAPKNETKPEVKVATEPKTETTAVESAKPE